MSARWVVRMGAVVGVLVAASIFGGVAQSAPRPHGSSATVASMTLRGVSNLASLARAAGSSSVHAATRPGRGEVAPKVSPHWSTGARSATAAPGAPSVAGSAVAGPADLARSFWGLNSFDQRFANNGNQFSVEPPDQGLCVGNGFVLETVNSVLRVYRTTGAPVTGPLDLNTFYRYPAQFDRTSGLQGPFVTDPSCSYDARYGRWIHVVSTLEVDPATGAFTGKTHLDVAVSATANPAGAWRLYSIPTEDNGAAGTPDHACAGGSCFGDFPHIGADANGFYISTNEYPVNGPTTAPFGYTTSQIYAIARQRLVSGASSIRFVHLDNVRAGGKAGFTVWPATSPANDVATADGGTEYFLSSDAAEEIGNTTGGGNHIVLWSLTNTRSLLSDRPHVRLRASVLPSESYSFAPFGDQKPGPVPLAQCLNVDCLGFGSIPPTPQHEGLLDTGGNESSVHHTWYANGVVSGALDTAVRVGGQVKAGLAWFVVRPGHGIVNQGYVGVPAANLSYPTVTTLPNGRGVMSFTLSGRNYFPSAAYTFFPPLRSAQVHIAAAGVGPQDGFSEYSSPALGPAGPRWGDYGAGVVDGRNIWFGTEAIAQRCSFSEFRNDLTCDGTRGPLTNWATRISEVSIR
jgi:hypothetical protein